MENASRALLMSAGILFAVMLISLFAVLLSNISTMGQAEEDKIRMEQLAKFNAEYEAYNKRIMYGTDVISVVNKAIDNNERLNPNSRFYETGQQTGFINVKITVIQDFKTVKFWRDINGNQRKYFNNTASIFYFS